MHVEKLTARNSPTSPSCNDVSFIVAQRRCNFGNKNFSKISCCSYELWEFTSHVQYANVYKVALTVVPIFFYIESIKSPIDFSKETLQFTAAAAAAVVVLIVIVVEVVVVVVVVFAFVVAAADDDDGNSCGAGFYY